MRLIPMFDWHCRSKHFLSDKILENPRKPCFPLTRRKHSFNRPCWYFFSAANEEEKRNKTTTICIVLYGMYKCTTPKNTRTKKQKKTSLIISLTVCSDQTYNSSLLCFDSFVCSVAHYTLHKYKHRRRNNKSISVQSSPIRLHPYSLNS